MQINEVEKLVGITKKNVRFYEQQGLLAPARKNENGYRQYTQKDVRRLEQIKLLRKIDVPIEEIKKVLSDKQTLGLCLSRHIEVMDSRKNTIERSIKICKNIGECKQSLDDINIKQYLNQIEEYELKGVKFVNVNDNDKSKKYKGALIAATVFTIFVILWCAVTVTGMLSEGIFTLPVILFTILFTVIPIALIIGVWVALVQRIKQIKKGEDDEASKY